MAYEDFTTYTEFDEDSDVTVDSATKVSWDTFNSRKAEAYLYKDKGVDHFDGDFNHKFETYFSRADDVCNAVLWMVSNTIGDLQSLIDGSGDGALFFQYDDSENLYLRIVENGGIAADDGWVAPGPQLSTLYFVEVVRDDDGGANNTGRYTAYIRTGSHSGALQDTLVVDSSAGEQNDFRYIFGMAGRHDSSIYNGISTGYTQNLDIGEIAPTTIAPTTLVPTTLAPTTAVPTTLAPTSIAPTTVAPTSLVPTTPIPTTAAPTSLAPTTSAPTTLAPTTLVPTTLAPTSLAPTTLAVTTIAPTTIAPTSLAPTTLAPTTLAPTTTAPTTLAPTSLVPTTLAPTTLVPTTIAPTTVGPTTLVPTTAVPLICVKNLESTITDEIISKSFIANQLLLESPITEEFRIHGNLC